MAAATREPLDISQLVDNIGQAVGAMFTSAEGKAKAANANQHATAARVAGRLIGPVFPALSAYISETNATGNETRSGLKALLAGGSALAISFVIGGPVIVQFIVAVAVGRIVESLISSAFDSISNAFGLFYDKTHDMSDAQDRAMVLGTKYAEKILGGDFDDLLIGGAGGDRISGQKGSDTVYGDAHNDIIFGGNGIDSLHGGSGQDRIHGENNRDEIHGGSHKDMIFGGNGSDTLYGGSGNDTMSGGDGADLIFGGEGNDTLHGGSLPDTIYGESGDDLIQGIGFGDSAYGGDGNDRVICARNPSQPIEGGNGFDILDLRHVPLERVNFDLISGFEEIWIDEVSLSKLIPNDQTFRLFGDHNIDFDMALENGRELDIASQVLGGSAIILEDGSSIKLQFHLKDFESSHSYSSTHTDGELRGNSESGFLDEEAEYPVQFWQMSESEMSEFRKSNGGIIYLYNSQFFGEQYAPDWPGIPHVDGIIHGRGSKHASIIASNNSDVNVKFESSSSYEATKETSYTGTELDPAVSIVQGNFLPVSPDYFDFPDTTGNGSFVVSIDINVTSTDEPEWTFSSPLEFDLLFS